MWASDQVPSVCKTKKIHQNFTRISISKPTEVLASDLLRPEQRLKLIVLIYMVPLSAWVSSPEQGRGGDQGFGQL